MSGGGLTLLVLGDSLSAVHPLPTSGTVSIGRSKENDIQIDDASISRKHALLHLGPPLRIEDLGSSNGTTLRGVRRSGGETGRMVENRIKPGESVPINAGDMVSLGSVVAIVQVVARGGQVKIPPPPRGPATGPAVVVVDPAMLRLHELAARVAVGDISILLLGETGSGKDVLAEAIHRASPRSERPLLRLNCAAFSELLLESELFGYERGAFTGANQAKPGLLETAHGGTVFLDEIGELPPATQAKLLRVIEDRKVLPVGSVKTRPIDVRFIAATNRDLELEIARGGFRQDLYYRLNGVALVVPPLRERSAEIEPMARSFAAQAAKRLKRPSPLISAEVMALFRRYTWPGNVRELRNVIDRAVLLAGDGEISLDHLPVDKMTQPSMLATPPVPSGPLPAAATGSAPSVPASGRLREAVEALERQQILAALEQCAGNQTRAAKLLGMPRRTLVKRLAAYDVPRPRKGRTP